MVRWLWMAALSYAVLGAPAQAQLSGITGALEAGKPAKEAPKGAPKKDATVEEKLGEGAGAEEARPWVSEFCRLSFFTQESDTLDLRRSPGEPCFDTGRGRDVFKLDPENFPEGVRVFSDRGRSVIRLSDGPSMVFDQESTAEEIRAGRGDDTLRLGVGFVGSGNPVVTPETRVFPGGGRDLIVVGSGLNPAIDARHVANARVFPEAGQVSIEAGCGRPTDPDSIDTIVENAGGDVQVSATVRGCGLALRNHAAPTVIDQEGGRFVALLRPSGEEGVPGAFFDAQIRASSGLNFSAFNPRPDTSLVWSGFGDATLQVEARLPESGGTYTASGDGAIFARVLAYGGAPVWDLASTQGVELVVEGTHTQSVSATVTAPSVTIEWRPLGEASPPSITAGMNKEMEERRPKEDAPAPLEEAVASVAVEGEAAAQAKAEEPKPEAEPAPKEADAKKADGEKAEGEEEAPPVEEPIVRGPDGMTDAARQALFEGRPVETDPTLVPVPARWVWETRPLVVNTQAVEWRIVASPDWCTTIGSVGGPSFPCGRGATFRLEPGQTFGITKPDGTRVWTLSSDKAVNVRWAPGR